MCMWVHIAVRCLVSSSNLKLTICLGWPVSSQDLFVSDPQHLGHKYPQQGPVFMQAGGVRTWAQLFSQQAVLRTKTPLNPIYIILRHGWGNFQTLL